MSIGEALPRVDGPIKVTGSARYTADLCAANMLHGVLVTASIPAGKVTGIDKSDALAEAGVISVLTHEDMPRARSLIAGPPFAHSFLPLQDDEIRHEGQPVALVLAETLEAAEAGARKTQVRYAPTEAKIPAALAWPEIDRAAVAPKNTGYYFGEPEFAMGNSAQNFELAQKRVENCKPGI